MHESDDEDDSTDSTLTFVRETFMEYEEDADQIRYVLEGLYSEAAAEVGTTLHSNLKRDNDQLITEAMRMKLFQATGDDQEATKAYLTQFLNTLGDYVEKLEQQQMEEDKDENEIPLDFEDGESGSYDESYDDHSYLKFENPQDFMEMAWNKAGTFNALLIFLNAVQDRLRLDQYEMDTWGTELLEEHPMFGGELWEMLYDEAGTDYMQQLQYVEDLCTKVQAHMDTLRPPASEDEEVDNNMELGELEQTTTKSTADNTNEPGKTQDSMSASAQTPALGATAAGVAPMVADGSPEHGLSG